MPDWLRVSIYVIMGYLCVGAMAPIRESLSSAGLAWLLAGGAVYSVGTVIFALDKPHLWPGKILGARLVAICSLSAAALAIS